MSTTAPYIYQVKEVVRIVDADTYYFLIDVGFRQSQLTCIRLLGYDCPERRKGSDHERAEGKRATDLATKWFAEHTPISTSTFLSSGTLWVRTEKDPDDFGRWLGEVWHEPSAATLSANAALRESEGIGEILRAAGLASVWPTRWHTEFDAPPEQDPSQ